MALILISLNGITKQKSTVNHRPTLGLNGPEYDYYNLLILRKNKEAKLFYVLTTMGKDDIASKIHEYWESSTSVGYDFDD